MAMSAVIAKEAKLHQEESFFCHRVDAAITAAQALWRNGLADCGRGADEWMLPMLSVVKTIKCAKRFVRISQ